jgi:hypothetical protein
MNTRSLVGPQTPDIIVCFSTTFTSFSPSYFFVMLLTGAAKANQESFQSHSTALDSRGEQRRRGGLKKYIYIWWAWLTCEKTVFPSPCTHTCSFLAHNSYCIRHLMCAKCTKGIQVKKKTKRMKHKQKETNPSVTFDSR